MEYVIGKSYPLLKGSTGKRLRDVVPNGDDFRSRNFGVKAASGDIGRSSDGVEHRHMHAFKETLARRVTCPICNAEAEQPCISTAKSSLGKTLTGVHTQRMTAAHEAFGRKRKK